MLAVYDLAVSPPTYDFIGFILSAERERIRIGAERFTVAIVPGPDNGFRQDRLPPRDPATRRAMLENIVKPICGLVRHCAGVTDVPRPDVAALMKSAPCVFPEGYSPAAPVAHYGTRHIVEAVRAGIMPFEVPDAEPGGFVTITLRQSHYWPARNSNLPAWMEAARAIEGMGLRTVFIPDSDWDGTGLDGFEVDREASTDLRRRARLYASARLNLAVNNGPTALMWAMPQARLLQFKMVVDGAPCCSPSFFASQGLPVGSQPGRPGHRIVWADDDAVRIVAEVTREIEGDRGTW